MKDLSIKRMVCARIPNDLGEFRLCLYRNNRDREEHLALIIGTVAQQNGVLVRVHSECFTGEVLGSNRCDCGDQLNKALAMMAREGQGVLIYLRQEGRGIGLLDKLRAYNLQDEGFDTVDANLILGHQADERDYSIAAGILADLGVCSVRLLTNNPFKIKTLESMGVPVKERLPIEPTLHPENARYLQTKAHRMNHLLNLASQGIDQENGNN